MSRQSVFISHSVSDEAWVRKFAESLRMQGFDVSSDCHNIRLGQSIADAMEKGLRESSVIVLLVTPDSVNRPNFFFEMGAAIGMGKRLVPVISRDVDPSQLPAPLRERQYLKQEDPEATAQEFASQAAAAV